MMKVSRNIFCYNPRENVMTFREIHYQVEDGVAKIIFNRPQYSNGFNVPFCTEILDALELADKDKMVKIIVFAAEGTIFSVGGDLIVMQEAIDQNDVASLNAIADLVNQISFRIKKILKPVIVCADGAVAGAAFNLSVAADFCIASEKTKFIQAFSNVGLAPDAGGLFLLTRSLGTNVATQLTMTAEPVKAEQALHYGFVYKVCPSDQLEKTLQRLIKRLNRGSFNSYAAIKQLILESEFSSWEDYAKIELETQTSLASKDDFKEGVRAYSEKRRPNFSGN